MRISIKYFIIFWIIGVGIAYGAKTDIYFGNGILTIEKDAKKNSKILRKNTCTRYHQKIRFSLLQQTHR
jgi:hypothetical protein